MLVCEICRAEVRKTIFCKRAALVCPNCMAKYDARGKRDARFAPLPPEAWLPSMRPGASR